MNTGVTLGAMVYGGEHSVLENTPSSSLDEQSTHPVWRSLDHELDDGLKHEQESRGSGKASSLAA